MRMSAISQFFMSKYGKEMVEVLDSETSGYFKFAPISVSYLYLHFLTCFYTGWESAALQSVHSNGTSSFSNKPFPALGAYRLYLSHLHVNMMYNRTNEAALTEILLGRSNADLTLLKNAYRFHYNRDLIQDVKGDLSAKTERSALSPPSHQIF